MNDKLIEIKNLKVSFQTYAGEINAIRGVNFHIDKGEILGIVGESGCGKSVTSSAIMRILPKEQTLYKDGEINFNGINLLDIKEKEMRKIRGKEISMIFQDSMSSLNPTMKIGNQVMEGILVHQKLSKKEAKLKSIEILKSVGISDPENRMNQYPHEFSGGMRQRVMIAMAIACEPKLLIADEPTTALDVTIQAQILTLMKKIANKSNTSVLLITHDLGVVAETCDRVVVMYAGRIIETSNVKNLFDNPKHPYTIGLIESVPSMSMDKERVLNPIPGSPPDLYAPPEGCSFFPRCNKAMNICEKNSPDSIEIDEKDGSFHSVSCWLNHPKYLDLMGGLD